ncbi:MAG: GntR family transcriptional regulator [Candidatus Methanomethylicaceae archaeon]
MSHIKIPPSLKELAFQVLKENILNHQLLPGSLYSEQAIAKKLGISKTPIHEALMDLENRGFVKILPRKGFRVNRLTKRDIQNMFEFRNSLERSVLLIITSKLTEENFHVITSMNESALKAEDAISFLRYDRGFHLYLASLTKNRFFIEALENIKDLSDWVGAEVFSMKGRAREAVKEHAAVIEMLRKRDAEGAANAMTEHLRITEQRFLEKMAKKREENLGEVV